MNQHSFQNLILVVFLLVLALIALFNKKKSKQELAEEYNISKPTLLNWMKYFQTEYEIDEWKNKRVLAPLEIAAIKATLGSDTSMVLSKRQIAQMAESDYKTVSANVKLNLDKIGITWEELGRAVTYFLQISQKTY